MERIFLSHSSANNTTAVALRQWLSEIGYDDVFLDIDPRRGLVPGVRWQAALKAAADRCESVLVLISPAWLASRWCRNEFDLARLLHKMVFGIVIEQVPPDELPADLSAEWQLCYLVGEGNVRAFEVKLDGKCARIELLETGLDLLRRGLVRAGLDARSFPWPPKDEPLRAPYRGMKALEPQDAAIFFGRDVPTVRGLDEIRGVVTGEMEKLFVVLGASGSGKSSFLRAGLWPRLARDDNMFLPLPVIRPQLAAISGTTGLAVSLSTAFSRLGDACPPEIVKQRLSESRAALGEMLDELLVLARKRLVGAGEIKSNPTVVIAIDQAEELFNPDSAPESTRFLEILGTILAAVPEDATHDRPALGYTAPQNTAPNAVSNNVGINNTEPVALLRKILVAVTIRSDHYEMLQNEPHLEKVRHHLFNLPPILQSEFKSVIEGPAERAEEAGGNIKIEPALTERLIADALGADALPLLGFTLERLYADFGSGGLLTAAQYDVLGGVQGSIQAAIQNAFAEPGREPAVPAAAAEQMACLRAAFVPWLARIDPQSGAPLRRVARLDEIPPASRSSIERLVEARVIIADARGGAEVREIAHESLLRRWSALTTWLAEDAANLILIEGIERASTEWMNHRQADSWLDHRGDRLATAEKLLEREDFRRRVGDGGVAYVAACRKLEEAHRKSREEALAREEARLAQIAEAQTRTAQLQRRARWTLAVVAAFILIGCGVVLWQRWTNLALRASLDERWVSLVGEQAAVEQARGNLDSALRLAVYGVQLEAERESDQAAASRARAELATARLAADWHLVLSGHTGVVNSAAFNADDSRIVTASSDGTARVWDVATGKQLLVFNNHSNAVNSAAFSPDGRWVVTASSDKTARVWDAETGRELLILRLPDADVRSAAFNFEGTLVVTGSSDNTARIWDAGNGREIGELRGHAGPVDCAAFSPDGTRIVTGSADKTAVIWDTFTLSRILVLEGHQSTVTSVMYSPDGSRILTGSSDNTARIWDAVTGAEISGFRGHKSDVLSAAFSTDGQHVVTASADDTARVWDTKQAREIARLRGHEGSVRAASFSHSSVYIVTASADKTARVWDPMSSHELLGLRGHSDAVNSAVFNPDGSRIVTASDDKLAIIWDSATGEKVAELVGHEDVVRSAQFSLDGQRVVTASNDRKALIWRVSKTQARIMPIMALEGHRDAVRWAAFSADGKRIVTASADRTARIWDADSGKTIVSLRGHTDIVRSAFFDRDGARVITASNDKTVRIWNAATGVQIAVLMGHGRIATFADFSPDGHRIVTASFDNSARIWDAATAMELGELLGHEDIVRTASFSPDGLRIVTASTDGTARVWDASSMAEIAILHTPTSSALTYSAFSPDGSRIVTASWDKTARIWDGTFAVLPAAGLVTDVCTQRLPGIAKFTRDEMRLVGYPDNVLPINVCAKTIAQHD